jgi:antitoxin YefM
MPESQGPPTQPHANRASAVRPNVRSDVSAVKPAITGVRLSRDIRPVTEFRANAAAFIDQVQATRKPVVLTQHGRGTAVLLDIDSFERLLDEVELLRDVLTAEEQVAARRDGPHPRVEARLRARLGR